MNRKFHLRTLLACLFVVTLVACGGGGSSAPATGTADGGGSSGTGTGSGSTGTPSTATHAGMGSSTAQPTGQAYAYPDGVQTEQPIKGDDPFCIPEDQADKMLRGSGGLVRLCLGFRNTGSVPITVVLPPGLIFIADDTENQNGIVLQRTEIVVPPTTVTYYAPVYLYCLNLGRHPTSGGQDKYHTGPVTDDTTVLDLLSLLQGKTLPLVESNNTVQGALWDITEHDGLTPQDRNAIAALH